MADRGRATEMTADDVRGVLDLLDVRGIHVWVDGGWAVDACLGTQTRRHSDLDIVLEQRDRSAAVAALRDRGYGPVPHDDTRAWNFVLGDDAGHEVDFHVIVLDEHGAWEVWTSGERRELSRGGPGRNRHGRRSHRGLHHPGVAGAVPHRLRGRRDGLGRRLRAV